MDVAQAHNLTLHLTAGPSRGLTRPTASILQPGPPFGSIPLPPLVPGLPTDAKTLAQSTKIHLRLTGQLHKLLTQRHDRYLFPGHSNPPKKISMSLSMCQPCPRRLSAMSPVYTLPWGEGSHRPGEGSAASGDPLEIQRNGLQSVTFTTIILPILIPR